MVNRLTLAGRPTLGWLDQAVVGMRPGTALSIVDIGSGYGDMLRLVHRWAARRGMSVSLPGVDLNPWCATAAAAATPPGMAIKSVTADPFAFRPSQPHDIIYSYLSAHTLPQDSLVRFLIWEARRV